MNFATMIEEAGADALKLNIYYIPSNLGMTGAEIEKGYVDILQQVKEKVRIPVAVNLSPYFSNLANMAQQLDRAGANALVLFNRFYQPDIDFKSLDVIPNIVLSKSYDMRLPLRWIALLKGRIRANLAATGAYTQGEMYFKIMMAGADVAMLNSVLLKKGIGEITAIEATMRQWMAENEYESVKQMQGSISAMNVPSPAKFERVQYMKALSKFQV